MLRSIQSKIVAWTAQFCKKIFLVSRINLSGILFRVCKKDLSDFF